MGGNDTTFTRPIFDVVTQVLNTKITPDMIEYARKKAYLVEDLYKERANKTELLTNFLRRFPETVVAASHGTEDALIGPEVGQNIIDLANTVWFSGKIVYLVACDNGKKLAPALVDAGAKAVLAWDDLLTIRIWSDTYEPVEGFKECLTKPQVLYDGKKVKEAYDETVAEYNKWIDYWEEKDPVTADVLRADRNAFKMYGSGESRIAFSTYLFMGMTDIFAMAWVILYAFLEIVRSIKPLLRRE